MDADFLFKEETREILGCAMEVHRELGYGLKEKIYENALVVEFCLRKIDWSQQPAYQVDYKGTNVGEFIPDLIAHQKIIIDTKIIKSIGEREIGQMLNYLKITKLKVGLIINFANPSLEWKRVVLT